MDPIMLFLKDDVLPEEKGEADKVRRKAPQFWLSEDQKLYKRFFSGPYLLCVHPKVVELLLEELHDGIYGSHTVMVVIQGAGHCPTSPLLKGIGGQICKKKNRNT